MAVILCFCACEGELRKLGGNIDPYPSAFPFRERYNLIAAPKIPTFTSIFKLPDSRYRRFRIDEFKPLS